MLLTSKALLMRCGWYPDYFLEWPGLSGRVAVKATLAVCGGRWPADVPH